MSVCTNCGAENPEGAKFCSDCGTAMAALCHACGAANAPGGRFCNECGSPLRATTPTPAGTPSASARTPLAERRLVSVLFADLVGFTPLSESRDPEDVRELLSRYFDT